jgi:hypothetical protein
MTPSSSTRASTRAPGLRLEAARSATLGSDDGGIAIDNRAARLGVRVSRVPIDSAAVHLPSARHRRRIFTETPMPIAQMLLPEFDREMANTRRMLATTPELLERLDRNVADARAAMASASVADLGTVWTLKNGGTAVFSMPRAAVLRGFVLSLMIHHRGQLSVYLRLRDVQLPSLYGPTADTPR